MSDHAKRRKFIVTVRYILVMPLIPIIACLIAAQLMCRLILRFLDKCESISRQIFNWVRYEYY